MRIGIDLGGTKIEAALVIHGDADRILPIASTGIPSSKGIKGARLIVLKDAPHGLLWTHADDVNRALVDFLT